MRWALLPRISLPTGVRRRRPMTISSAPDLLGDGEEVLGGLEAGLGVADVDRDAGRLDAGPHLVELGLADWPRCRRGGRGGR